MFTTCWTEDILAETIHAIRRRRPDIDGGAITRVADRLRQVMSERIDAFDVPVLEGLNDPMDRHVHGAAVGGGVAMLVTEDSDFHKLPQSVKDSLPYDLIRPDEFFLLVDDSSPECVRRVVNRQWEHLRRKDPAVDLSERLGSAGCPVFAERVWRHQRS